MRPIVDMSVDTAAVSPDGRWIAMGDAHTGRSEVYVRRVSGDGISERITAGGGATPVWLANGRERLYIRGQDILSVAWHEDAGRFEGERERLCAHVASNVPGGIFDARADGRVLVGVAKTASPPPRVRIILNWQNELARTLAR